MQTHQSLTLDRYLSERGPLDPLRAGKVAIQVALQMAAAGGSFLIHPGRILAGKDGSVRLLPPPAEDLSLPPMVEFPAYVSPEEIRGGRADIRSGLYSLGCTLFELVTGTTPYPGKDPKEVLRMHLELAVPEPRGRSGAVPSGLAETIKDLLAKDPELRIQTPDELVRRLRQSLGGGAPAQKPAADRPAASPRAPAAAPAPPPAPRVAPRARRAPLRSPRASGQQATRRGGRAPALRAPASSRQLDIDIDDEEAPALERPARKRSYAFTATGAIIGLLIGGVLVLQALERKKGEPAIAEEAARAELDDARRKRKEHFTTTENEKKAHIDRVLAQVARLPPEGRRELLNQHIVQYSGSRWGHLLAAELVKLGPAPKSKLTRAEDAEIDKAYRELKAEAEKLRAAGRLGDAIQKMMEDYQKHKVQHDAEITAFVEKLSTELTEKWEATKKEADREVEAGNADAALALYRKAEDYGDGQIRTEVGQRIEGIQARAATIEAEKKPSDEAPLEEADAGDEVPDEEK